MVNGINSADISKIQALRALNAFQYDAKTVQKGKEETKEVETSVVEQEELKNEERLQKLLLKKMSETKLNEIQNYAKNMNQDLSYEDINYGITYGRSVLVDYSA